MIPGTTESAKSTGRKMKSTRRKAPYRKLDEVTGLGKTITVRNKYDHVPFIVGQIEDEVSVSDGEQKYFFQRVRLADKVNVENDPTRYVFRIGYYTRRADGCFCLGSQFAPTLTAAEFRCLLEAMTGKGWLELRTAPMHLWNRSF